MSSDSGQDDSDGARVAPRLRATLFFHAKVVDASTVLAVAGRAARRLAHRSRARRRLPTMGCHRRPGTCPYAALETGVFVVLGIVLSGGAPGIATVPTRMFALRSTVARRCSAPLRAHHARCSGDRPS